MLRKFAVLFAVPALALTGMAASAAPGNASPQLVTCTGTENATYSPGLKQTDQTVTITTSTTYSVAGLGACVNLSGNGKNLNIARETFSGTGVANCVNKGLGGTGTIVWGSGDTSTFAYTVNIALRPDGILVLQGTGTITLGLFAGDTLAKTVTEEILNPLTGCIASGGLISSTGAVNAIITSR
jgi:hypothetical protein